MLPKRQKMTKGEDVLLEKPNSTNGLPDERNPLLNDVVLGRIFKVCPLSELRRFRLVSKQWYSLTLARFRKEMTVVIRPPTLAPRRKKTEFDWDSLHRTLLIGDQPFRNYRLSDMKAFANYLPGRDQVFNATKDNSLRMQMLNRPLRLFCNKFGSWIHKLELCDSEVDLLAILKETPDLEELILNGIHQTSRSKEEELGIQPNLKHFDFTRASLTLPFSWNVFFRHFPNIERVDATLVFGNLPQKTLQLLLEVSEELDKNNNLKFFVSPMEFRPSHRGDTLLAIRALELKHPQMTIQKIIISGESQYSCEDEELRQLISIALRDHGHTLEELELVALRRRSVDWFADFPFHPGPFTSLTTLELTGQFCKNLRCFGEFPNVSTLKISDYEEKTLRMGMGRMNSSLENIRVFHFSTKSTIPDHVMTIWVNLMPNVEDFVGILSDSSLRIICDKWRKLKSLFIGSREFPRLMKRKITDEAITGIVAGRDERFPNIADLQDLESLSIPKPEKMSDTCIWNVFLKMPRLQHLAVQLSEETSEEAFQALIKKFPGDSIFRDVRRRPKLNRSFIF